MGQYCEGSIDAVKARKELEKTGLFSEGALRTFDWFAEEVYTSQGDEVGTTIRKAAAIVGCDPEIIRNYGKQGKIRVEDNMYFFKFVPYQEIIKAKRIYLKNTANRRNHD